MSELTWIGADETPAPTVVSAPVHESTRWLVEGLLRDARHLQTRTLALTFGHLVATAGLVIAASALAEPMGVTAVRMVALVLVALSVHAYVVLQSAERSLASLHAALLRHLPGSPDATGRWEVRDGEPRGWRTVLTVGTSLIGAVFLIRFSAGL